MPVSVSFFQVVDAILYPGIVFFLGLILGSFSTALIYRVPRGISWVFDRQIESARSACPSCRSLLGFPDLVPVFSWLFLKGRCRRCGVSIGAVYPMSEAASLLGCFGIFMAFGLNGSSILMMLAVPFLVALFVIDLRHMILPNQLVAILGILGLVHAGWLGMEAGSIDALLARLISAGLYLALSWSLRMLMTFFLRREAMGLGDVKFFGAAGAWIGIEALPLFLVSSGFFGLLVGLYWKYGKKEKIFPFGPALILALYAVLIINA